jgi:Spy/CpxP family protein refolding chaperone
MHRFKLVVFSGALLAVLTLSAASSARPPFEHSDSDRDPGAFIEENAEALGLDDETLTAIRSIVEKSKGTGDQLHARLRELHEGMKTLLAQDTPDESAVMQQIDSIGLAETEMHKHRLGTMLEIRALLTPEQREAMTQLREDSRGRWKHALREACEADVEALCPDAADRWSRKQCLHEQRENVSEACQDAMKSAKSARRGAHKGCPNCPMHEGSECPMQRGVDCPMHGGSDCPMHRKSGGSEQPESGETY